VIEPALNRSVYKAPDHALAARLQKEEIHIRLLNWGRWHRADDTYLRLGYPRGPAFALVRTKGRVIADLDAQHIEWVISTMNVSEVIKWGRLHAFVLKVEYIEHDEKDMPHVSQRARDVRRRFKRRCAESTYYQHLNKARQRVHILADPII